MTDKVVVDHISYYSNEVYYKFGDFGGVILNIEDKNFIENWEKIKRAVDLLIARN